MKRVVMPEWLDALPPEHPEARRNRLDLRWLNGVMGSHRWLERSLRADIQEGDRILEIGAGQGELARRLRRRVAASEAIRLDGLDRCPAPVDWPSDSRWWRQDACVFDGYRSYTVIVANLLLHQFRDSELARLGQAWDGGPRLIVACEPARRVAHLFQLKLLSPGLGRVSRHDGAVSIRAGFVGDELPRLLGLDGGRWDWRCATGWRGQYFMVARRKEHDGKK